MKYSVIYTETAKKELFEAYDWICDHSPTRADKWRNEIISKIESLESMPYRCAIALEDDYFDETIYHLIFGNYKILYYIESKHVIILHIRHCSRNFLDLV